MRKIISNASPLIYKLRSKGFWISTSLIEQIKNEITERGYV